MEFRDPRDASIKGERLAANPVPLSFKRQRRREAISGLFRVAAGGAPGHLRPQYA
jgi:hypothetical protein